jgi:hypothetical protein
MACCACLIVWKKRLFKDRLNLDRILGLAPDVL